MVATVVVLELLVQLVSPLQSLHPQEVVVEAVLVTQAQPQVSQEPQVVVKHL